METSAQVIREIAKALYRLDPQTALHELCSFGDNMSPRDIRWATRLLVGAVEDMIENPKTVGLVE